MSVSAEKVPPQAPEGGLFKRLLGRFYVTGVFWYRFHRWGVNFLPHWAIGVFIFLFTTFFFVALRRIRKAIAHNLEAVLGPCGWWERQKRIYRTMWNLAWCLSERYERFSGRRDPRLSITGEELWRRKLAGDAGFVMVTAHIGNWETALLNPAARDRRSIHIVREEEVDPRAQEFIRDLVQGESGERVKVHFVCGDDARLAGELLVALRNGDVVAVQGDRPRSGGRTLVARVFGRELELPIGPVVLARAAGVDLLPVFCFRRGRLDTEVVVREPIRVARTGDRARDVSEAVERVAGEIEWAIRQRPFQWFCFRDLWGRAPAPPEAGRRWAPSPGTRSAALVALLATLVPGCAAFRDPVVPMRVVEHPPKASDTSGVAVVLLPGRHSRPEAFERNGVVELIHESLPTATLLAVDSHLGYYRAETIRERLWQDVVRPARERFSEVWLVGTSLGGIGALAMVAFHPEAIDGAVLLAPYLGPDELIDEIERADGPRRWRASAPEEPLSDIWSRVRDQSESGGGPRLYLGFGASDRLAPGARLLATLLPEDRVLETRGGHRWSVWVKLLEDLIARGALTAA